MLIFEQLSKQVFTCVVLFPTQYKTVFCPYSKYASLNYETNFIVHLLSNFRRRGMYVFISEIYPSFPPPAFIDPGKTLSA